MWNQLSSWAAYSFLSAKECVLINNPEEFKKAGTFTLSGKDIYGELTLAGNETSLYLQDENLFDIHADRRCIKGVLRNLKKVTLIQCITQGTGNHINRDQQYHYANVFPHYVAHGDTHLDPDEEKITAVRFVIDDAATLFYDFDAFGVMMDASPFIEQIAKANSNGREIATGPRPYILYFTGKSQIFAADTVLGQVSAWHNPAFNLPNPNGVGLKNTIAVVIDFGGSINFNDAMTRTTILLQFLSIMIGRPQNLLDLYIDIESNERRPVSLKIFWSMPPKRLLSHEKEKPHPAEVLLSPIEQSAAFSNVLRNWLGRNHIWKDARARFYLSFSKQRYFTIDRLIGSSNMFDILPDSAVPVNFELTEELIHAKQECQTIFGNMPQSPERDSVLNVLGRIGKSTLKRKIRHRVQFLIDKVGDKFPDLCIVTDEAVNCRNHYVHGSKPKFDYSGNFSSVFFFTETLEFVFAASDLIEAGWDIKAWSEKPTSMSHPFSSYHINYLQNLQKLKLLLK